jgi:DNA-binding protein YbaB
MDLKNFDLGNLMQQAQKMQQDLQKQRQILDEKHQKQTEVGVAGADDVAVEVNLLGKLTRITIAPTLLEQPIEIIGQLICAAANQAIEKAAKKAQADRAESTKNLNLPFDVSQFLGGR